MNLTGTFKTTRFSDLLRYYAISKDSATLRVWLGPPRNDPDGIFEFANGQLVDASLQGARGKDAIRNALTLREGSFAAVQRDLVDSGDLDFSVEDAVAAQQPPLPTPAVIPTPLPSPAVTVTQARPVVAAPGMAQTLVMESPVAAASTRVEPPPIAGCAPVPQPAPVVEAAPVTPPPAELPPAPPAEPPGAERGRSRRPLLLGAGALLAVVTVATVAVAVGAGERSSSAPARPAVGSPAAAAPAEAAATGPVARSTAPRGVLPDSLVLGMVSSFTGSNKERGRAMRIGWEMAIAEANEAGGIHGRKIRLVLQDDGYDPRRTLAGMKAVFEEGSAFAIVGNVGTATAAVAIPYAAQHDAVFFGALSGGDLLRKTPPDRHVFNFRASLGREGEAAVRYLVDVRRAKPQRIAIVSQDDEFGASGRNGALRQLGAYGMSADRVLQLTYPRNTTDVRQALAELRAKRANVDAVVMVATYKPAATLVRKARDAGLGFFFTTVSADSGGLAEELVEAGGRYARGVLLTQVVPVPASHATTLVRYRQALEKYAAGERPGSTSLEAWLGAQIFLEGVRRAGRDLDTGKLIAALESIHDWDMGIGGNITFGRDDHQGCDVVWGWLLEPDGTYRQIDLE